MSDYTASVDYSTDGGKTYVNLTDIYTSSLNTADLNTLAANESPPIKRAIFRAYRSGSTFSDANSDIKFFYIGGMQMQFTSYYKVYEHKYMCVVKRGEFNRSLNPSLYDVSGSQLQLPNYYYDTAVSESIFNMDENFRPFATGIGLYDDAMQLVAYAKFASPIRVENDFDSVFIIKFDV